MCDRNLEWTDPVNLDIPDFFVDIYTLDREHVCDQPIIEFSRDFLLRRIDDRNIIPISRSECKIRNIPMITLELRGLGNRKIISEELMCSNCNNPTFFVKKIDNNWFCPPCAIYKMKNIGMVLRPNCCDLPAGCDSCGGIVNRMAHIQHGQVPILLCLRDECLMSFGYCLPKENASICTCAFDRLTDLKTEGLLINDLTQIVEKFFSKQKISNERRNIVLADLYMTKNDQCLPCQIMKRYQVIAGKSPAWEIVNGKDVTCSCNSGFLTRSFSRWKGSSTFSTPVSSTNRRRSQSNGDLTDEYTDSTSEI